LIDIHHLRNTFQDLPWALCIGFSGDGPSQTVLLRSRSPELALERYAVMRRRGPLSGANRTLSRHRRMADSDPQETDFCGISKGRLIDEIDELRKRVDAGQAPLGVQLDTVNAIDDVRKVGNIGAHMKADINVIGDVDPNEAQVLIEPVELLFLEWYVARAARADRLAKLKSIAEGKKSQQQAPLALRSGSRSAKTSRGA
jgi:hypothetical protein